MVEKRQYFYKGKNPDNYIKFNDELWRIININEDGSLRIRRNESIGQKAFDSPSNKRYQSDGYCNSSVYGCNVWGSKTNIRDASGNLITKMPRFIFDNTTYDLPDKNSELEIYLNENWYKTLSDTRDIKQNSIFNVGQLYFKNDNLSSDIKQEKSYTWQGNVGLIEISDYSRTNTNQSLCNSVFKNHSSLNNYETCKSTSWIYDSYSDQMSLTPNAERNTCALWVVKSNGASDGTYADVAKSIYPVLNLKDNISLIGIGSINNPYQII